MSRPCAGATSASPAPCAPRRYSDPSAAPQPTATRTEAHPSLPKLHVVERPLRAHKDSFAAPWGPAKRADGKPNFILPRSGYLVKPPRQARTSPTATPQNRNALTPGLYERPVPQKLSRRQRQMLAARCEFERLHRAYVRAHPNERRAPTPKAAKPSGGIAKVAGSFFRWVGGRLLVAAENEAKNLKFGKDTQFARHGIATTEYQGQVLDCENRVDPRIANFDPIIQDICQQRISGTPKQETTGLHSTGIVRVGANNASALIPVAGLFGNISLGVDASAAVLYERLNFLPRTGTTVFELPKTQLAELPLSAEHVRDMMPGSMLRIVALGQLGGQVGIAGGPAMGVGRARLGAMAGVEASAHTQKVYELKVIKLPPATPQERERFQNGMRVRVTLSEVREVRKELSAFLAAGFNFDQKVMPDVPLLQALAGEALKEIKLEGGRATSTEELLTRLLSVNAGARYSTGKSTKEVASIDFDFRQGEAVHDAYRSMFKFDLSKARALNELAFGGVQINNLEEEVVAYDAEAHLAAMAQTLFMRHTSRLRRDGCIKRSDGSEVRYDEAPLCRETVTHFGHEKRRVSWNAIHVSDTANRLPPINCISFDFSETDYRTYRDEIEKDLHFMAAMGMNQARRIRWDAPESKFFLGFFEAQFSKKWTSTKRVRLILNEGAIAALDRATYIQARDAYVQAMTEFNDDAFGLLPRFATEEKRTEALNLLTQYIELVHPGSWWRRIWRWLTCGWAGPTEDALKELARDYAQVVSEARMEQAERATAAALAGAVATLTAAALPAALVSQITRGIALPASEHSARRVFGRADADPTAPPPPPQTSGGSEAATTAGVEPAPEMATEMATETETETEIAAGVGDGTIPADEPGNPLPAVLLPLASVAEAPLPIRPNPPSLPQGSQGASRLRETDAVPLSQLASDAAVLEDMIKDAQKFGRLVAKLNTRGGRSTRSSRRSIRRFTAGLLDEGFDFRHALAALNLMAGEHNIIVQQCDLDYPRGDIRLRVDPEGAVELLQLSAMERYIRPWQPSAS